MKGTVKIWAFAATIGMLTACGNNNNGEKAAAEQEPADQTVKAGEMQGTTVAIKDDKLNAVYQHYVHLTSSLVKGDAAEAKIAANAIETGARELNGGATLAKAAANITAASDIDTQRREYSSLSNEFIALTKKSGLSSGELYVEYCPMAMNDKGAYWLSASKEIRNPYFGDKMLECGEVKETLN